MASVEIVISLLTSRLRGGTSQACGTNGRAAMPAARRPELMIAVMRFSRTSEFVRPNGYRHRCQNRQQIARGAGVTNLPQCQCAGTKQHRDA